MENSSKESNAGAWSGVEGPSVTERGYVAVEEGAHDDTVFGCCKSCTAMEQEPSRSYSCRFHCALGLSCYMSREQIWPGKLFLGLDQLGLDVSGQLFLG